MGELITINTAMRCLERILGDLPVLQDRDQDRMLKLIRAQFERHSLDTELIGEGKMTEELQSILDTITPERICRAVAMDELGAWCRMIRTDITLALLGEKL